MSKLYDENIFQFTGESVVDDRYVIATYYLEDSVPGETFIDHLQLVGSIALEGSTGTWMRIREDTPELRRKLTGKCVGYYEIPCDDPYTKKAIVQIALPIDAWQANAPMLLLAVAGNCFAVSNKSRVLDVTFPKSIVEQFPGPKFGVEGMRKLFNVPERPLVLHIIKPKMGMTPEQTAQQVYDTALGGADLAKDDEMCSDVYNSDTIERSRVVAKQSSVLTRKPARSCVTWPRLPTKWTRFAIRQRELSKPALVEYWWLIRLDSRCSKCWQLIQISMYRSCSIPRTWSACCPASTGLPW